MNRALTSQTVAPLSFATVANDFFRSVLDATEHGIVVLDQAGATRYMNPTARRLLAADEELPREALILARPMMAQVRSTGLQAIDRWNYNELILRARLRPLAADRSLNVLELSVAHVGSATDLSHAIAQRLGLRITDARLLTMLWRGLSNSEIAANLQIPVGTVKSRLNRLYQVLGVKTRSTAVLCAAEVLTTASRGGRGNARDE